MSRQTFIFVGTTAQDADLMRLVEQALGGHFRHEEGSDPTLELALSRSTSAGTSSMMMTSPGQRDRKSLCTANSRP
jgi:hypothetical protein